MAPQCRTTSGDSASLPGALLGRDVQLNNCSTARPRCRPAVRASKNISRVSLQGSAPLNSGGLALAPLAVLRSHLAAFWIVTSLGLNWKGCCRARAGCAARRRGVVELEGGAPICGRRCRLTGAGGRCRRPRRRLISPIGPVEIGFADVNPWCAARGLGGHLGESRLRLGPVHRTGITPSSPRRRRPCARRSGPRCSRSWG